VNWRSICGRVWIFDVAAATAATASVAAAAVAGSTDLAAAAAAADVDGSSDADHGIHLAMDLYILLLFYCCFIAVSLPEGLVGCCKQAGVFFALSAVDEIQNVVAGIVTASCEDRSIIIIADINDL